MPLNFNIAPGSYVQALVCFATALLLWLVSSRACAQVLTSKECKRAEQTTTAPVSINLWDCFRP